ncbi:cadherin-like protein 26 [Megalops cyprinoides]|uniref:cadherin-like protein 26 n=1 Tax=Megalops cyprinoides TaxID=118141 RepID=UPI001863EB8D|nr:cadherin-like protein 26 [Megalops cyprinoides]
MPIVSSASPSEKHIRQKRSSTVASFTIAEEHPGPFPYELGIINMKTNYPVRFALQGQGVEKDPVGTLSVDQDTGRIYVHKKVDYELYKVLRPELVIYCVEVHGSLEMVSKHGIEISIADINDHAPRFQNKVYETTIEESLSQGTKLTMVLAIDGDAPGTTNSKFDYRIASVIPNAPNIEFFIEQSGLISFKGCLDYDVTQKYTILVEAKDHGEVVRLSSMCTVVVNVLDRNNHLPTFIGHVETGRVKAGESGKHVLRLQVEDKDKKNTPAWRAKYTIYEDKGDHFKIETDPVTNDGVLIVEKPLMFEEGAERTLSISVENEEPYFYCELKKKTTTGLWQVVNTGGMSGTGVPTQKVTIILEDISDPPIFARAVEDVTEMHEKNTTTELLLPVTMVDSEQTNGLFISTSRYMED